MTTGASSSNSDASPGKKKGRPRGRKRRLMPKDSNAPKGPLSGYMLFMNEQREALKQSQSKPGFPEITKIVAQKWAQLDVAEKQKYLEAAEADKERYQQEVERYKKTEAYKKFMEDQKKEGPSAKRQKKESAIPNGKSTNIHQEVVANNSVLEIPIFTEEFLNHNKMREGELRQLRKSNTEYEEQNTILQKHIESMRAAVEKLEDETRQQQTKNASLKQHLSSLRKTLSQAFSDIPVPGSNETPKEDTVDNYISQLHSVITSNPQQHPKLVQNVKQIVNNLPNN
ncbi:UNVERIFIED_CONTAM: hypothetical protein GTU68_014069 [Idotea baltica]|nr:hypothetical protein [Idotea baltica]